MQATFCRVLLCSLALAALPLLGDEPTKTTEQIVVGTDIIEIESDALADFSTVKLPLLPIAGDPYRNQVRFSVDLKKRCMFGDFDAIVLDQKARRKAGILSDIQVTIESLDKSRKVYSAVSFDDLLKKNGNLTLDMSLPNFTEPTLLGVFLCTHRLSKAQLAERLKPKSEQKIRHTSCQSNSSHHLSVFLLPHTIDVSKALDKDGNTKAAPLRKPATSAPPDRTYFFKFIIGEPRQLSVPRYAMDKNQYKLLKKYLEARNALRPEYQYMEGRIQRYGSTLGSLPLKVLNSRIQMVLPYYAPKKCTAS